MRVWSVGSIISTVHPLSSPGTGNETAQSCSTFGTQAYEGFQFAARIYRLFALSLYPSCVDVICWGLWSFDL